METAHNLIEAYLIRIENQLKMISNGKNGKNDPLKTAENDHSKTVESDPLKTD